jgi:ribokinase
MSQIDFLAIGDIVTEPFIRLKEAEILDRDTDNPKLAMRWGDKIPYDHFVLLAAVGNAANAAVSASRLGVSSGLRAYVGADEYGKQCLSVLETEGVSTEHMVTEDGKHTNYHYVLWYENDRTILVKHEDFTYTVPTLTASPKWIYLSSLADHTLPYHEALTALLGEHPETKLAFQPGTFQMSLGVEALKGLYERTELYVVNKDEARRILHVESHDIKDLINGLHLLGPKLVVVTDNTNGAYASDGTTLWHVPMYPDDREAYERTGAGDAFASTLTAALSLGKTFEEALLWAPINSMAVVQEVGAQKGLLTRAALEEHLERAPESYKLEKL